MIVIRTDGNGEIGLGHIMRCVAVANAIVARGDSVSFAVSNNDSKKHVEKLGFSCVVLRGDYRRLSEFDADALANYARSLSTDRILVDSYGVCDAFFKRLKLLEMRCAYIDDAYTFEHGFSSEPRFWEICSVINYGFGFESDDYRRVYGGSSTSINIGPRFAPVRSEFWDVEFSVQPEVSRVLLTSGATNPNRTLERMAGSCHHALPNTHLIIVVGALAEFDESCVSAMDYEVIRNARNMSALMAVSDMAITAAGSTLYELSCIGIPMIALPVAENQVANAHGVKRLSAGGALINIDWDSSELDKLVGTLGDSFELRKMYSQRAKELVDGAGARRIAECLF